MARKTVRRTPSPSTQAPARPQPSPIPMGRCLSCRKPAPDVDLDARYEGCTHCGAPLVFGADEIRRMGDAGPRRAGPEADEARADRLEGENRVLREIAEDSLEIIEWLAENHTPGYRPELRAKIRKALGTEGTAA